MDPITSAELAKLLRAVTRGDDDDIMTIARGAVRLLIEEVQQGRAVRAMTYECGPRCYNCWRTFEQQHDTDVLCPKCSEYLAEREGT